MGWVSRFAGETMNFKIVSFLVQFDTSQFSNGDLCNQLQTALLPWSAQISCTVTASSQWTQGVFSAGSAQFGIFLTVPSGTEDSAIQAALTEIFSAQQLYLIQPAVWMLDGVQVPFPTQGAGYVAENPNPFQIIGAITVSDVGPQPGAGAPILTNFPIL